MSARPRAKSLRIAVEENGARYFADLATGQKTGWYYDQRDNRAFMAALAKGRSVLDAYSYTGGFGIAGRQSRRRGSRVSGFVCAGALAIAEESARGQRRQVQVRQGRRVRGTGASRACQRNIRHRHRRSAALREVASKDLEPGAKAYRKLARLAAAVVAPNGFLLLASCSHNIPMERFAAECAAGIARSNRSAALIRQAGAGPDHPVHPMLAGNGLSESAGLRARLIRS